MLLAKLVLTLALAAADNPRFHLLDGELTVAPVALSGTASKKCPSLFPKMTPPIATPLATPAPDAALKKTIADAFAGRTRATACIYSLQGVRRHDPRFGMRQVTLELTPPVQAPVHLLLRTVVGRFEPMHDLRHNQAEVYAGLSY